MSLLAPKQAAAAPADTPPPSDPANQPSADESKRFAPTPGQRPEHVPEKFWKDGKLDDAGLVKSYTELETRFMSKTEELKKEVQAELLKARPEAPDKYELKAPEGVDPAALAGHGLTDWWRKTAFEKGMSNDEFNQGIAKYVEAVLGERPDPVEETKKLGENAQVRLGAVSTWAQKTFTDPDEFKAVQQIATTAAGVRALERVMGRQSSEAPGDAPPAAPTITEADLKKKQADPRYWDPARRDPAFIKEVEEGWAKLYPPKAK